MLYNELLKMVERYKSWVGPNRCLDHFPIVLELDHDNSELGAPFKFNPSWVVEDDFQSLVREI